MKKLYVLALSFAMLTGSAFAQKSYQVSKANEAFQLQPVESVISMPKAQNPTKDIVTLWQNDFSDFTQWQTGNMPNGVQGEFEWTPNVAGLPADLVADDQGLSYFHGQLFNAPSVENGFVYYNGIQYLLAGSVQDQNFFVQWNGTAIDLTGVEGAFLRFYQRYRAFNVDETYVEVSVDGGTNWTSYIVNDEVEVNTYAPMDYKVVNISSAISGVADLSNIKIRFRWQSVGYSAPQYGSGYGWLIDDVQIYEAFDNDMVLERPIGCMYHFIPTAQVQPITLKGAVHNFGMQTQNNVVVSVKNGTETLASSTPKNLAPNLRDTITAGTYTFPGVGVYALNFAVSQDETDQTPENNSKIVNVEVNDSIYARDNGKYSTGWQISDYTQIVIPSVVYEVPVEKQITHVQFAVSNKTVPGVEVVGILYEYEYTEEGLAMAQIGTSDYYEIQAGDINESGFNEDPIFINIPLIPYVEGKSIKDGELMIGGLNDQGNPKQYLIGVYYFGNTAGTQDFEIGRTNTDNEIFVPEKSMWMYKGTPDDMWYYYSETSSIPMIRMRFKSSVGINEFEGNAVNFNVYPNPAKDVVNVAFNSGDADNYTLRIVGINGQVVFEANYGQLSGDAMKSINVSNLQSGVYFIQLMNEKGISTKKFVRE